MAVLVPTIPLQRRDWLGLLFVLVVAALLRLDAIQYNHFLSDEADVSRLAQGIVAGTGLPLLANASSVGIPNSPAVVYIMAIPYFFSNSPLVATGFVAALNVLGVGLVWWLGRRLFNPTVGFFAALIYAVSPWAIWFSSKIWTPDINGPLLLLSLVFGILGFVEGKRWAQVLCLPIFILAIQLDFSTLALLPVFPWLVWMGRRRLSWPALMVSVLLTGLMLYPFFAALEHTGMALNQGSGLLSHIPSGLTNLRLDPLVFNFYLSSGMGMTRSISYYMAREMTDSLPTLPLWGLLAAFAVLGLIVMWRMVHRSIAVLISLWILVPVVILIPSWVRVIEHYFAADIAGLCLLAAVGLVWLLDRLLKIRRAVLARAATGITLGTILIILLTQIAWFGGLLRYLDVTPLPEQGTPLHYLMDVRQAVIQSDDILIALYGSKITRLALWQPLLFRTAACVRQPVVQNSDRGAALLPVPPFVVLTAPDNPEPVLNGLYVSAQPTRIPIRPGEGAYTIYSFDHRPDWNGPAIQPVTPARFDNNIQFTGYHLDADSNRLYLRWDVLKPPDRDYQYFVHLLNAAGEKAAQRDVGFYDFRSLCAGDQVITWLDMTRAADAVTLRVGMYSLDAAQHYLNSVVVDEQGNRGLPWVDIPLKS